MAATSISIAVKSLVSNAAGNRTAMLCESWVQKGVSRGMLPLAGAAVTALLAASPGHAAESTSVTTAGAEVIAAAQASAGVPVAAGAQAGQIDQVLVTASSTSAVEEVREVPVAISVIAGEDLQREDATTLEAIARRLANVKWNYGNSQTSNYSIRGIGKIANNPAADPSVGINVDGIAYAYNPLGSFNFYDVETASVWRGPQGLRGGKNSVIGQVNVRNKGASFTPSSEFSFGYSTFENQSWGNSNGTIKAFAANSGALIDDLLAYRVALNVDKGGGWLLNKYNPDNQYISSDRVAGRAQLLFTPSENFDARLTLDVNPRMQEYANIGSTNFFFSQTPSTYANGLPNTALSNEQRLSRAWFTRNSDYTVQDDYFSTDYINSDTQQALVTGRNTYALELGWNVGENSRITSLTGFADYYFNAFRDDEGTVFDVQSAAGNHIWYKQKSQELRFESKWRDLVDYQAGLYLIWTEYNSGSNSVYGTDGGAWFATNAQYGHLDTNSAGRQLLSDSLGDLWRVAPQTNKARSPALYTNLDWHLAEKLTLNTGVRVTRERRGLVASQIIKQNGYGVDLNPAANGGFSITGANLNLSTDNTAEQLAAANRVAQRYFGVNYTALTTGANGQRQQIADARAIRGGRIGTLHSEFRAESYRGTQVNWSISPRYELNENQSFFLLVGQGEKAGVPVVLTNGGFVRSQLAKPERNRAFELGSKSRLLNGDLTVDATFFLNDIKDYLQNVFFVDELQTQINGVTTYTSGTGNVPKVRAKGLELDVSYSGLENFEFRFSGAYNDAKYKSFPAAAYPVERGNESVAPNLFLDVSGETLPGASKVSFNVGIQYHKPIFDDKEILATLNTSYASKYKSDNALSEYSWIKGTWISDATFSIGGLGRGWTAGIFVKNLLNDDTPRNQTWNAWAPQIPRQYGLNITGKL